MGSDLSRFQTPFSANIEISFGEEESVRVREVWRNTTRSTGEQAGQTDRQEHAALQGVTNSGGAGATVTTAGGSGVSRSGGATGGQRRGIGGAPGADSVQGGSTDNSEHGRNRNVTFVKAGKCFHKGKKHNQLTGSITPASTNRLGKRKITETITLAGSNSDLSDTEESLEEMEKRLAKMLELKFKRRKGPNSSNYSLERGTGF